MKKLILFIFFVIISLFKISTLNAYNPHSYIVYDSQNKQVLAGENIDTISLIASTTKILTAIVAIENGNLFDSYVANKDDCNMEGSKVYLKEGESYFLYDLLYGLMLRSGNDCANIIARNVCEYKLFIQLMNKKCRELKMKNSTFENPSGLDTLNENRSTAYDMAILMSYAMENEIFREISSKHSYRASSIEGTYYFWKNKDKSIIYDERFIAGKTGYTKKSGRVLVNYAETNDKSLVIVTINDSNDWSNHKKYLDKYSKVEKCIILREGIYKIENYKIEIENLIKIYGLKDSKKRINYKLLIKDKSYLLIYFDDLYIKTCEVKLIY